MQSKRRLPIIAPKDEGAPPRPAWQWIGLGALAILVMWLPLAAAAGLVGTNAAAFAATSLLALAVASLAGGFVLGKWGSADVGLPQAAMSGLVAALGGVGASWMSSGVVLASLLVAVVAVPVAAMGAKIGLRMR